MNKKKLKIRIMISLVFVSSIFLVACAKKPRVLDDSQSPPGALLSVVEANNQFAFELYLKYKTEDGNLFFSPYSLSSALAMTYEGARGETAQEMQSVFHFPEDDMLRRGGYADLYNEINKKDQKFKLSTANALWAEQDFKFSDDYFNLINQYYGGQVTNLDFKKNPEASRLTINNWVEEKTNDKIEDLIPEGVLSRMTRLVLTNAIYFKGQWLKQFSEDDTRDSNFRVSPNNNISVEMMQKNDDKSIFPYFEDEQIQALELPYSGDELSMLILLPKDDDMESLENVLSSKKLATWKKDLREQRVNVYLPKFEFETKYFMADTLAQMGMPTAFSGWADFSGMTGKKDLFISDVIHQAFVEVNEEGTEAAAATAVIMMEESISIDGPKIPVFRADHPFIFLIEQKESGNILFIGRVSDPS